MDEPFQFTPVQELNIALARAETRQAYEEVEARALVLESTSASEELYALQQIRAIAAIRLGRQDEGLALFLQQIHGRTEPERSWSIWLLAAYIHLISPPCDPEELFPVLDIDGDPIMMGTYLLHLAEHLGPDQIPSEPRVHHVMERFFDAIEEPSSTDINHFIACVNQYIDKQRRAHSIDPGRSTDAKK